jgi:hypothetical protein
MVFEHSICLCCNTSRTNGFNIGEEQLKKVHIVFCFR